MLGHPHIKQNSAILQDSMPLKVLKVLVVFSMLCSTGCHHFSTRDWSQAHVNTPKSLGTTADSKVVDSKVDSNLPLGQWWKAFNSLPLDSLVETLLEQNLSLEQAVHRLSAAHARTRTAGAPLWPQVSSQVSKFSFSGERGFVGGGTNAPGGGIGGQVTGSLGTLYSSTTSIGYELDIWGKLFAQFSQNRLNQSASREDIESLALALTGTLFEEWLNLQEANARINLIKKQIATNQTQLKLQELRVAQGIGSLLAVLQQKQQLLAVRSELPQALQTRDVACFRLQTLLAGLPQQQECSHESLPNLPKLSGLPYPATVLLYRPDVRAALLRVQAADLGLANALANHLPSIRLSLSWQYNASTLSDLFESSFRNLLQSLEIPWFDGDRRLAQQDLAKADMLELIAAYREVLLNVFLEIETALSREKYQRDLLETIEKQLEAASDTLRVATRRYLEGATNYLDVITASDALQRIERRSLLEKRNLLSIRGQLYRALGTSETLTTPEAFEERPSLAAFFPDKN
jgi:multidrug efflux system outer membrane protein